MSPDTDVVVVGAGPAGCETARRLSAGGARVVVLEEHEVIGQPVQCAGLVALHAFDITGLPVDPSFHQNTVTGGHIHAPDGRTITVDSGAPHAHVVDRAGFDRALAARAEDAGVEMRRGASYRGSTRGAGRDAETTVRYAERTGGTPHVREISCRILIGADGVGSEVARSRGFPRPGEVVTALEVDLDGLTIDDPQRVHVHVARRLAPGFFAWVVPKGPHGARIGLALDITRAGQTSVEQYYQRYLQVPEIAAMLADPVENYRIVGAIPMGLSPRIVDDGVALVGDAAGFAKPTSGGGIYMGVWGAQRLAPVVLRALERNRTDARSLLAYQAAVRRGIGRELAIGEAMRGVYRRLHDGDFNRVLAMIDEPSTVRAINKHGDIDYPSRLLVPLLVRHPSLVRYAAPAVRELIRSSMRRYAPGAALTRERRAATRRTA